MHVPVPTARTRWLGALGVALLVAATTAPVGTSGPAPGAPVPPAVAVTREAQAHTRATLAAVPLHFETNRGQVDRQFDFTAAGAGYRVGLAADRATIVLTDRGHTSNTFRFVLDGARADAEPLALETLPGTTSYYRGNDPAQWQVGIATHARVRYAGVFDGIDVIYYGNQRACSTTSWSRQAPTRAASPSTSRAPSVCRSAPDGRLQMAVGDRVLEQGRPFTYQEVGGQRREVASRFVLDGTGVALRRRRLRSLAAAGHRSR